MAAWLTVPRAIARATGGARRGYAVPMASGRESARRRSAAAKSTRGDVASGGIGADEASYWVLSTKPLHVLVFLLPLLVAYEIGAATYVTRISAETMLSEVFGIFGSATLFVPGIAMVTVLVVWHVLSGDSWRVQPRTLGGMLAEAVVWTLPLIVLGAALGRLTSDGVMPAMLDGPQAGEEASTALRDLPWTARLTVAIGAGLYEEMLFRLVGIAALHLVLKDLMGVPDARASVLAVVGSAVAFALYHDLGVQGGGINWHLAVFSFLAGAYFGSVYVMRGFGIVVGTHALYDVAALFL
jgi:hypothetical protein